MKQEKSKLNAILGGTLSLTLSTIIVKILGLIYKIPLATILGDEGMGYFNSGYTVYSFFYLLCTAGVPKSVMILVSKARAEENYRKTDEIISVAAKIFSFVGLISFAILTVFSAPLARLIGNSKSAITMIAVAPSIIFISLASVIRGSLSADLRLIEIAVSQIIEAAFKLVTGLCAAHFSARAGMSAPMISAMTILGVSFGSIGGLIYLIAISKIKITKVKAGQKGIIRQILRISIPITVSATIMSLTNVIDLGLIMRNLESIGYTEQEAAALYGNYTTLAVPMFNLALAILTPISIAHLPLFTDAIAKNDVESLILAEDSSIRLSTFIAAPITVGLITYGREILTVLFPSSDIKIGSSLLCLLSPAIILSSFLLIVNNSLEAGGYVKAPLISMSVGCLVKAIASIILIKNQNFGISGAPIGTVLSYLTALIVSIIIYRVEYDRAIVITSNFSSSMLFSLATILPSRLLYNLMNTKFDKLPSLLISIFCCAVSYFCLHLIYGFLRGKGQLKVAKYTNFDLLNCQLKT